MTDLFIMNIFTNTLDIYALYYFFKKLLGKSGKTNVIIATLLGLAVICNTFINITMGLVNVVGLTIMIVSCTLIFNLIFNKNKIIKIFALLIIGLILMFTAELIVVNGISLFFKISPKVLLQINYYKLMAVIFTKFLFILAIGLGENFFREIFNWFKQLSIYPILLLITVNLLIVFMVFTFYTYADADSRDEMIYIVAMGIAAFTVSCVIMWIIKKMIAQQKKELLWQMKEREYENQQIYLEHIQEVIQTLRAQRHDYNNYLSTIYGLIYLEKLDEAKKYILNLSSDAMDLNEVMNVYHPVVGAILNMKKEKAARNKIDFNVDVDIPMKLPFDFVDLSTILGNLLDNAIEACEKVENTSPKIYVNMYIKNGYMVMRIENSKSDEHIFSEDQLYSPITTKFDKENHGLGIMNIRKAVNKYNGIIKIKDMGVEFLVDIALPFTEDYIAV